MGRGRGREKEKGGRKANKRVGGLLEMLDEYLYLSNCPPTPSPNSTTVNRQQVKVNVELGEE